MRITGVLVSVGFMLVVMALNPACARTVSDGEALLTALREADEVRALHALEEMPDLNKRDITGATALMWAVQRGNLDMVARLLKAGANPNLGDSEALGPLQLAVQLRATNIALLLLDNGAEVNAARNGGETVLMTAARTGQLEVAKKLLALGADVNAQEQQFHQTALMWSTGYPQMAELLIASGANINAKTKEWQINNTIYTHLSRGGSPWAHEGQYTSRKGGQNALFFAIQRDDIETVRTLIKSGIDVNERAADGSSALLMSLYKWKEEPRKQGLPCNDAPSEILFSPNQQIANVLLDNAAQVNVADTAGNTPLHGAALGLMPVVRINKCRTLINRQQYLKYEDRWALERQAGLLLVQRLLELGADPNAATKYPTPGPIGAVRINPVPIGSTPVHIAADSANAELLELLLKRGGNGNAIRSDGLSPLAVATVADDAQLIELLIAYGGDVKLTYGPKDLFLDHVGTPVRNQTLMHIAAFAGSHRVIPVLGKYGVPSRQENQAGETALTIAETLERHRYENQKRDAISLRDLKIAGAPDPESIKPETLTSSAIKKLLHSNQAIAAAPNADR